MKSEQVDKIIPALLKAQAKLEHASKDSSNPHFKSKYADLATVLDTCKPVLEEFKLGFTHQRESTELGEYLITTLWHETGQFLSSRSKLKPTKEDPQGYGSAMTYARRYDLSALIGLASEDDDGNAASAEPAPAKSYFKNAAERNTYTANIKQSFENSETADELNTIIELEKDKLKAIESSGNNYDAMAVDEIRKTYKKRIALIKQDEMMKQQLGE